MTRFTKKQIKVLVNTIKEPAFNFNILGVYFVPDTKEYYVSYKGQGVNSRIYNNEVEYDYFSLEELTSDFRTKKDLTTYIYNTVNSYYRFI